MTQSRQDALIRQLQGALDGNRIRGGAATLTWPGGTIFSNSGFVLPHDIGTFPIYVNGTAICPAGGFVFEVHPEFVNAANVQWRARTLDGTTPAAGTTKDFYWVAIG